MTAPAAAQASAASPLGIVAGSGHMPRQMIEACLKNGRSVHVIAIEDETDPETVRDIPHLWIRLGAVGSAIDYLHESGVSDVVLAGKINRPSLSALRPDSAGARLLSRLGFALLGGDTAIFKIVVTFIEEEGFRIVGVDEIMKDMVTPEGPLGRHLPDKQSQKDIALGARLVRAIGAFDVGQGVVVKNGLVLGIEAAEGTDALIERCAGLMTEGKGGVLVKARKPAQEERVDLPTIGLRTLELANHAGFAGIAVEARHSLIVSRKEVIRAADALGLFVIGFSLDE